MSEDPKPAPTKRQRAVKVSIDVAKIVAAITSLIVVYNGYRDLENKNALLLEALGSKLNALSEKVAHLEGHIEEQATAPTPVTPPKPGHTPAGTPVPAHTPTVAPPMPAVVMVETPADIERMPFKLKAYETVPTDMKALQLMQQEQVAMPPIKGD
jgi:hypothetical protein